MKEAAKRLKKQQRFYIEYVIRGILLFGIGLAGGIMVPLNGVGKTSYEHSKGAMLYKVLEWMEEKNISQVWVLAGIFYILAIIGIVTFLRGLKKAPAAGTELGKSLLTQARNQESIDDMIRSIDEDLERGSNIYDTVYVGREWILSHQAMRLSGVRGIFRIEAEKNDFALGLVDEELNVWGAGFDNEEYLDNAYKYLRKRLPDAVFGDYEAYMAYIEGKVNERETIAEAATVREMRIPAEVTLCLIKPDGIPTSNYTWSDLEDNLNQGRATTLSVSGGSANCAEGIQVFEISCNPKESSKWKVQVRYQKEKIRFEREKDNFERGVTSCLAAKVMDARSARDILKNLIETKRLPEFLLWEEENA